MDVLIKKRCLVWDCLPMPWLELRILLAMNIQRLVGEQMKLKVIEARKLQYNAGHEDPGYPSPPTAPRNRVGQRQDYLSYPGDATPGYNVGQRQQYHGYPAAATATGYDAGKKEEGQGFASPTAAGYDTGLRNKAQGFLKPAGAAYGGELRNDAS